MKKQTFKLPFNYHKNMKTTQKKSISRFLTIDTAYTHPVTNEERKIKHTPKNNIILKTQNMSQQQDETLVETVIFRLYFKVILRQIDLTVTYQSLYTGSVMTPSTRK